MKKVISLFIFLAAIISSCCKEESFESITERVFDLAQQQCCLMDSLTVEGQYMSSFSNDGKPVFTDIHGWCSGFFPGTLWEVYEYTRDKKFSQMAARRTQILETLVYGPISHDIGFMINCSYGNAYKEIDDVSWLPIIEKAAERLTERYNPVIGATRSWDWNGPDGSWEFPVIVDNMMNLELLMNASELFNRPEFAEIARSHADKTLQNQFRDDFSCWHVVDYSPETGLPNKKVTHQGYSDNSAWSRGEAWGLYGFTMMAEKTGDEKYLQQAINIAGYLFSVLPEDGIPYWDFCSPDIPDTYRDASAGAIMASGFISLSKLTGNEDYLKMAQKQIRTLASEEYLVKPGENGGFLLKHSVGSLPSKSEVDVSISYADYYFLEALLKLRND